MTNRPDAAAPSPRATEGGRGTQTNANNNSNNGSKPHRPVMYQPLVHQFKCHGLLRMDGSEGGTNDPNQPLNLLPSSLCKGIATKVQTVGYLPPVSSPQEAVNVFRTGFKAADGPAGGTRVNANEFEERLRRNRAAGRQGGGGSAVADGAAIADAIATAESVSCYGSTEVRVLTVTEVPAAASSSFASNLLGRGPLSADTLASGFGWPSPPPSPGGGDNDRDASTPSSGGADGGDGAGPTRDPFQDLFGDERKNGGGAVSPGDPFFGGGGGFGPFGPFGGIAGGMSGGGGGSYRSVSTTSSVVDGKRVTTKETTTVVNGERKTVKETTTVHPDGRREVITEGGGGNGNDDGGGEAVPNEGAEKAPSVSSILRDALDARQKERIGTSDSAPPTDRSSSSSSSPTMGLPGQPIQGRTQIVTVFPDCRLGLVLSDQRSEDERRGVSAATVRVGNRGFAVASEYDVIEDEVDEDEKGAEYMAGEDGRRQSVEDGPVVPGGRRNPNAPRIAKKKQQEGIKDPMYYLNRTAESMERNAKTLYEIVTEPDFPGRVVDGGRKVAGNFGRTWERMEKVAGDVYRFWTDDDEDGGAGGQNGGSMGGGGSRR